MKQLPTLTTLLFGALLGLQSAQAEDLLQIYQSAHQSDPILKAAEANHQAIIQNRHQNRGLYLPSINFSAQTGRSDQENTSAGVTSSSDFSSTSYSVSLRQAIYRQDHMSRLEQADAGVRQSSAQLQLTRQALIQRVAEHYFNILAAQDSLAFAEAEKSAIARQLEQTKQRFEVGLIAITDVHESQAAHDLALAGEISAANELAIARQALQTITGSLPGELAPLKADTPLLPPEPADIEKWVENALAQNFAVRAAHGAVEVAQEAVNLSRAGHHPTLDLVADYSNSDVGGGFFGKRESQDTSIAVQLNVPIYQGGSTSAGVSAARYQLRQVRQQLEQTRRSVGSETRSAYLTVLAGISRVQALKQAVISSESALKATEAGYEVGTRTTVDVLNSRRELFRAQRDYARARYDYIVTGLALKQAVGTLDIEDINQINQHLE